VLSAYNDFGTANSIGGTSDSTWQDMTSPAANSDFISNTSIGGRVLEDVVSKVNNVRADSTSIINALAQLRAVRTEPPNDRPAGVTDVKLFRVAAWGTKGHVAAHFIGNGSTAGIRPGSYTNISNSVSLYPNIVTDNFTLSYSLLQSGTTFITVFDVFGNEVMTQKVEDSEGNHRLHYSTNGLSAGTYFLRFQTGDISEVKKFIVVH
jgi:hypothetical protein